MAAKKSFISVMFFLALVSLLVVPHAKLAFAQEKSEILKIGGFNPRSGPAASWGFSCGRTE
jgi:hypothetical protein